MKRICFLILICAILFTVCGCSLKAYKYLGDTDDKGSMINVDGVIYREKPTTAWSPNVFNKKMIGVTGMPYSGDQYGIYTCEGDTDRIFVLAIDQTASQSINYFYRDDVNLPVFERKNIDTVTIGNNVLNKVINTNTNPQLIDKIFALFNTPVTQPIKATGVNLYNLNFMNSQYKGVAIETFIIAMDGEYWIVNWSTGNEMYRLPQDLLEELVGKKMPTASEYIASLKK